MKDLTQILEGIFNTDELEANVENSTLVDGFIKLATPLRHLHGQNWDLIRNLCKYVKNNYCTIKIPKSYAELVNMYGSFIFIEGETVNLVKTDKKSLLMATICEISCNGTTIYNTSGRLLWKDIKHPHYGEMTLYQIPNGLWDEFTNM